MNTKYLDIVSCYLGWASIVWSRSTNGVFTNVHTVSFADTEQELLAEAPADAARSVDEHIKRSLADHITNPHDQYLPTIAMLECDTTDFTKLVWEEVQKIPVGQVRSYQDVAIAIDHPKAYRAVARACAANRIALLVPCHRVVAGGGAVSGYRWGVERKRMMLERERNRPV